MGPLTVGDIALHLYRVQSVVSDIVTQLESKGVLERERDHPPPGRPPLSHPAVVSPRTRWVPRSCQSFANGAESEEVLVGIGVSVFLLAVGGILAFAVTDRISGVDLTVVGYVLMGAGAIGIVVALLLANQTRRSTHTTVREERDLLD